MTIASSTREEVQSADGREPVALSPTLLATCGWHFSINWSTYGSLYDEDSGLAARYLLKRHLLTQVEAFVTHPIDPASIESWTMDH